MPGRPATGRPGLDLAARLSVDRGGGGVAGR